jgi:YD repeat-containing protein
VSSAGFNHTGACDVANQSYSWDGVGNLLERDDMLNSADEILTYDPFDLQITGAINGGSTRSLAYDASGNIIKKSTVCTVLN